MYAVLIFLFQLGDFVSTTVQVYSPAQDSILQDNTIVFIRGTLNTPLGKEAFINANQHFVPFPGNPQDDNYKKTILDMPYLHVCAIGKVLNQADLIDDGMA